MDVLISLSIVIFQLLNFTAAEWNPKSALILVDKVMPHNRMTMFPSVVRMSDKFQCKVYFEEDHVSSVIPHWYCPNPDAENKYCNYAENPREICPISPDYDIKKVINSEGQHENCDQFNRAGYHRYKIVYLLCKPNSSEMTEIKVYEVCYKDVEMQIIYGSYTIYNPSLLQNEFLADEQNYSFKFDISEREDFFQEIQATSYILYKQNTEYVSKPVLPPEWLPFGPQRKTLFNYMNAGPMHKDLIQGWEVLLMNLKLKIYQRNKPLNVTAGLYGGLYEAMAEYPHTAKKHLGSINDKPKFEIPDSWWVLIYNENNTRGVAIIMHNKPYSEHEGKRNMDHYDYRRCGQNVCAKANLDEALPSKADYPQNFIYCCFPSFITSNFNLPGSRELLEFPRYGSGATFFKFL